MTDIIATAKKYWISAGRTGLGHYIAAEVYAKRHRRIGIPSVVISTVVATSIFSTLSESVEIYLRIGTGFIALVAAILAALQAFLAYGELAEKHRSAGARYGKIRRDIDIFILKYDSGTDENKEDAIKDLQILADELGKLASDNPTLNESIYTKAKSDFDNRQESNDSE